jgi:hypothetical protein
MDGARSFRRRFPGEAGGGGGTRGREGRVGWTGITARSVLGGFVGLGLGCMGVFLFEENGWRSLFGVGISTASMITFGWTGVVGLGVTGLVTGSSSVSCSPGSSSPTTLRTFFLIVRCREALVVNLEEPALAMVVRVAVRAEVLRGGLIEGGFFDGGFA